jgi:hypothetical protein
MCRDLCSVCAGVRCDRQAVGRAHVSWGPTQCMCMCLCVIAMVGTGPPGVYTGGLVCNCVCASVCAVCTGHQMALSDSRPEGVTSRLQITLYFFNSHNAQLPLYLII